MALTAKPHRPHKTPILAHQRNARLFHGALTIQSRIAFASFEEFQSMFAAFGMKSSEDAMHFQAAGVESQHLISIWLQFRDYTATNETAREVRTDLYKHRLPQKALRLRHLVHYAP